MGFAHRFMRRFQAASQDYLSANERLSDIVGGLTVVSRVFRLMLQSALLGLGAYLTISGEMTAGAIIACSIAASRALAPIEVAIANWRGFVAARQSSQRLDAVFASLPQRSKPLLLQPPSNGLSIEGLAVAVPGTQTITLSNITFAVKAGSVVAVIGPSAAGKSTLARAITGVWPLARGAVRLDGAAYSSWSPEELGKHVGYLPQDVQLFDGTITENICRFEENPDSLKVITASQMACVHEMVLRLPNGYETRIGSAGSVLSAGQRQRIALARALYGNPFLVVLDEPNSNLDSDGEAALIKAIEGVKGAGRHRHCHRPPAKRAGSSRYRGGHRRWPADGNRSEGRDPPQGPALSGLRTRCTGRRRRRQEGIREKLSNGTTDPARPCNAARAQRA